MFESPPIPLSSPDKVRKSPYTPSFYLKASSWTPLFPFCNPYSHTDNSENSQPSNSPSHSHKSVPHLAWCPWRLDRPNWLHRNRPHSSGCKNGWYYDLWGWILPIFLYQLDCDVSYLGHLTTRFGRCRRFRPFWRVLGRKVLRLLVGRSWANNCLMPFLLYYNW